jgi:UDPglucose 6-dehydrogenase
MGARKKIAVVGLGYVGSSMSVLLAEDHDVVAVDTSQTRVNTLNSKQSPIRDADIEDYLKNKALSLRATTDAAKAYAGAEYVIVATPTDYNPQTNYFDTSSVESVVSAALAANDSLFIIIKSTIPVGFTAALNKKLNTDRVLFSPEFLREGRALYDNLHPSRIVVGGRSDQAETFAKILLEAAAEPCPVHAMGSTEAEAVKLFSNTYLAMRVAYFNELDTYAELHGLDSSAIVKGVSGDPRIGDYYNNPSFGYGGYCLPKDTKQLSANFADIPHDLVGAIISSNDRRIEHVVRQILQRQPKTVGVYRLIMKAGSDNFRSSAVSRVIDILQDEGVNVIAYEPTTSEETFESVPIERSLEKFITASDVIVANRLENDIKHVREKVYTRDVFNRD